VSGSAWGEWKGRGRTKESNTEISASMRAIRRKERIFEWGEPKNGRASTFGGEGVVGGGAIVVTNNRAQKKGEGKQKRKGQLKSQE